jgi:hypothetical protein
MPVTVVERSIAWTVFARSDAWTVGWNPTQGMDVYCLCCVCIFLCLCTGRGLATSWSPVQEVLPTVLDLITEVKRKVSWRRPRSELGCRAKGKNNIIMVLHVGSWTQGRRPFSVKNLLLRNTKKYKPDQFWQNLASLPIMMIIVMIKYS